MDQSRLMATTFTHASPDLSRIHQTASTNAREIVDLLRQAQERGVIFQSGLGRELDREQAKLEAIHSDFVLFSTQHIERAMEVVHASISIGEIELGIDVDPSATHARFLVKLPAGPSAGLWLRWRLRR